MAKEPKAAAVAAQETPDIPSEPPAAEPKREPDEGRIRERAYEIWVEEGMPDGRHLEHWLRARFEIEG